VKTTSKYFILEISDSGTAFVWCVLGGPAVGAALTDSSGMKAIGGNTAKELVKVSREVVKDRKETLAMKRKQGPSKAEAQRAAGLRNAPAPAIPTLAELDAEGQPDPDGNETSEAKAGIIS
jgi:hypothetical protein